MRPGTPRRRVRSPRCAATPGSRRIPRRPGRPAPRPDRRSRRARRRRPAARRVCRRRPRPGSPSASRPSAVAIRRRARPAATCARAASSSPGGRRAAGRAARRPPARRARRHGAAPTPAGRRWLSASRAAADNPPGTLANRSPTMMTAPGVDSRSADFTGGQAVERGGLGAGHGLDQPALPSSSARAWRTAQSRTPAGRACVRPCATARTRSATRLRVRSRPAAPPGPIQVGVADRHRPAGHVRGQELGLLGRMRTSTEVDVVGVQRYPGELRVRVGVLDGRPAADQHAGTARGRPRVLAAACRSLATTTRVGACRRVADQRSGERSAGVA